jgi:hypothetical protein
MIMPSAGFASVTKLSATDKAVLLDPPAFETLGSTQDLPADIVALCADDKGRLAEPGAAWEANDIITDDSLPHKRLIWAAKKNGYYVAHYESGGRGHSYHVLLVMKNGTPEPIVVWHGIATEKIANFSTFAAALNTDRLDDSRDYRH